MKFNPQPHAHAELLNEVLSDAESRAIYEATKLQIAIALKLKKARLKNKMTQNDIAKILHTKVPAVSRIESCEESVKHFPSLLTIAKYASAVGYELKINFVPTKKSLKNKTAVRRVK